MSTSTFQNDVQYGDNLRLQHGPDFSPSKALLPPHQCATITDEEMSAWITNAQKMVSGCSALEPNAAQRLQTLIVSLKRDEATVAFGGHFKSGKSTLINALLGRPILPTSGLPETGAMCIMSSGPHDSAHLCDATGRRALECTTEAIRHEISLTSLSGQRRTQTHDVERLELVLSQTPIGPRARWIDSPGINDTEEMTECAHRAAAEADMLLWVLNTRQFLSIAEVDFISERIAKYGPQSVALIVNAFLMSEDSAEWDEFLSEQMPIHGEKLRDRASDIGFSPDAPPMPTVVAGRVLGLQLEDWDERFGGKAIVGLMNSLSSPEQATVQRARWSRVITELLSLEAPFAEHLKVDVDLLKEVRSQAKAKQKAVIEAAASSRTAFKTAVEKSLDDFQQDWELRAYNCGETLANSIVPPSIWRDDTYTKYLNSTLESLNAEAREALGKALVSLAQKYAQTLPDAACLSLLGQVLFSPPVIVIVPDTPAPVNVDNFVDSLGFRGQEASALAKVKANAEATQQNVRHVTQYAATFHRSNREQAIATILKHCVGVNDRLPRLVPLESFSGGEVIPCPASIDVSAADEPGTSGAYAFERSGVFSCRASKLRPHGACLVRLHFAETRATVAGERRFHVSVEGKRVLSDYDIFARTGGNKIIVTEFVTRADSGGNVSLSFEAGSAGQPQVCAVQVIPQEQVTSQLSQLKVRVQRRHELWRDLLLLKEEAGKLVQRF
ncbi:hypothetical protein IAD21_06299 [Abditibacteriota bacterium]|nr:hypothetical protein IAD21_06299 [Abditibacteriota bacterium]